MALPWEIGYFFYGRLAAMEPLVHLLDKKCREEENKPGMSKMSGRLFFLPLGAGKPLGAMLLLRAHSRSGSRALGH